MAFGGFTQDRRNLGELREWIEGEWSLIDGAPDKAAAGAGFVFDTQRGCFVLFGGGFGDLKRGTTWEWDGTAWATRDVPGPEPRARHGLRRAPRQGRALWRERGAAARRHLGVKWSDLEAVRRLRSARARRAPGLAYDSKRGRTLLFGGGGPGGTSVGANRKPGRSLEIGADSPLCACSGASASTRNAALSGRVIFMR